MANLPGSFTKIYFSFLVIQRTVRIEDIKKTNVIATKENLMEDSETLNGLSGCIILPACIIKTQTDRVRPIPRKDMILGFSEALDIK